ncbi:hypothetical protein HPB51_013197 [Rhipicephalus microplus]|uniref:Uncharacterized protein n=1 Tax=Rhipicephalus microplus TaxID=6941 RepID=A0A9J6DMK5_RHIMP|nr:hypothetical protein HPB51_013197 [Rhipicephalus microplus]
MDTRICGRQRVGGTVRGLLYAYTPAVRQAANPRWPSSSESLLHCAAPCMHYELMRREKADRVLLPELRGWCSTSRGYKPPKPGFDPAAYGSAAEYLPLDYHGGVDQLILSSRVLSEDIPSGDFPRPLANLSLNFRLHLLLTFRCEQRCGRLVLEERDPERWMEHCRQLRAHSKPY